MANKTITFKMLAYSDAAGKYDPQAPLNGNEDNFYVDDDLSDEMTGRCQMDKVVTLSDCGCLMVVADGMGGMNAGEVASEIAINTVKDFFAPGKIDSAMAESASQRKKLLEQVIKEADKRVKEDAKANVEHEGMGSTIILAWIVGDKLTLSWCGDSRAYRFNPKTGIEPLSRDHSYVQELVNQGKLTYEDTFEHPQGNIVTRSLGDPSCTAQPETREFDLYNEDIILLCSDGLSGVLRDKKVKDHYGNYYPGETIEDIIAQHTQSVIECRTALMQAAENADWYDNVTVLLFQVTGGASAMPVKKEEVKEGESGNAPVKKPKALSKWAAIGLACLLCIGCFLLGRYYRPSDQSAKDDEEKVDSTVLTPVPTAHPVDTPQLAPPAQAVQVQPAQAEQVQATDSLKNQAEWNQYKELTPVN
jgi:protein phosphatase